MQKKKNNQKSHKKLIIGFFTAVVFIIAVCFILFHGRKPRMPEAIPENLQEIAKLAASPAFNNLSDSDKDKYFEVLSRKRADSSQLGDKEKETLRENMRKMMQKHFVKRVNEYFALPPDKRNDFLDKMIEENKKRAEARRDAASSDANRNANSQTVQGSGQGSGAGRGLDPQRMRDRLESSDPDERAKMAQFRMEMRQRMQSHK